LVIYNGSNYFPWTIIYEAFTKEVDKWSTKLEADEDPKQWKIDSLPDEIQEILNKIDELSNSDE